MNTGTISSRYAKALLLLTREHGSGEAVAAQVRSILADPDSMPAQLEPDLENFIGLLVKNRRIEYVKFILGSFLRMYYEEAGIRLVQLTTCKASEELEASIRALFKDRKVLLETRVDPSLLGGFVLTVDDMMVDASVRRKIENIRRSFIEKNRRIV